MGTMRKHLQNTFTHSLSSLSCAGDEISMCEYVFVCMYVCACTYTHVHVVHLQSTGNLQITSQHFFPLGSSLSKQEIQRQLFLER